MKKSLFFFISFAFYQSLFAQPGWEKKFSSPQSALYIEQTSDSGYIILGRYAERAHLSKLNKDGDTLWTKQLDSINISSASSDVKCFRSTSDGGYVIIGYPSDMGLSDSLIISKLDQNGNTIWTTYDTLSIPNSILFWFGGGGSIIECNGGYYATTIAFYLSGPPNNFYAVTYGLKINNSGNILWSKNIDTLYFCPSGCSFGGLGPISIEPSGSGNYLIAGKVSNNSVKYDFIMLADPLLNKIWKKPQPSNFTLQSFEATSDSGFIYAGYDNNLSSNIALIKTNSSGDTTWTKIFPGTGGWGSNGNSVRQTSNGGYIIAGEDWNESKAFLLKTDSGGNQEWKKNYGHFLDWSGGISVQQTTDGGFVFCGYGDIGAAKQYVVKTDTIGNITTNNIAGNIYNDYNGNCVKDAGDIGLANRLVELNPGSFYSTTDANGNFSFDVDTGIFTVKLIAYPYSTQICPATAYTVTLTSYYDSSLINDFADSVTISCPDLSISVATNALRPCMRNTFVISYCNEGTDTANNVLVNFIPLDTMIIPLTSSPTWTVIGPNAYQFNIGTLLPNQCGTIYVIDSVSCNATLGLVKCVTVQILPMTGDCDSANNSMDDCHKVIASFDPNDKQVVSQDNETNGYVNGEMISPSDTLIYRIRFQNTGSDTAFNIVILDTLSPYLDIATVQPGVCSHNCTFRIYGQRILEWTFNNILLPDSGTNEVASHGFVTVKARQILNNPNGTLIKNGAAIIFDFNSAVITNTSVDTVLITPTWIGESDNLKSRLFVYPNPSKGKFMIQSHEQAVSVEILNVLGEIIHSASNISHLTSYDIDLRSHPKGIYFYKVTGKSGQTAAGKIILE